MNLRQLQELKKGNVPQYRKDFIRLVSRQDSEIDASLDDLLDESDSLIRDNSSGDKIQDQDKISLALPAIFAVYAKDLLSIMKQKNEDTAQIQADYQTELVRKEYVGVPGFAAVFNRWQDKVDNYVADVPKRFVYRGFPGSSYTVGGAIKTIEKQSIDVVRSILDVGIREGKSARQIAADIDMYLKPLPEGKQISPFQWIRDRFGGVSVAKIKQVPAGSVSFNSFRIARTEINNTFRYATIDMHKGQPWVEGFKWNLSASHPKLDICDDWASHGVYKATEIPDGHPHCMCYVTTVLVPAKEVEW